MRPRRITAYVGGYILFEAILAIVLLSAGAVVVQRAMGQALIVRGQGQDFTQVRFLLEDLVAELEIQPLLRAGTERGTFPGVLSRFSWERQVSRAKIPGLPTPSKKNPGLKPTVRYLTRIRATVKWTRAGQPFEETLETLLDQERLYVPKRP